MKNRQDYQIGSTFQHGGRTYKVEHQKEYKSCHGCAFCEPEGSRCTLNRIENDIPVCIGLHRADGLNVVFVETSENEVPFFIEERAKQEANELYPAEKYLDAVREAYIKGFVNGFSNNQQF
ncbi:MAG: hypothetical protein J6X18_08545 [Bacteroidales bacterium]|nr:hypothetical protein [Bacteroidales bacterium]